MRGARVNVGLWVAAVVYCAGLAWLYFAATPEITDHFTERELRQFRVMGVGTSGTAGQPEYLALTLAQVRRPGADLSRITFLLPGPVAEVPGGDLHRAKVLERHPDWQLVRYDFVNTHSSVSRYRAYRDRVEPVSFRVTSDPGLIFGAIMLLLPAWLAGALAGWIARRLAGRRG